MGQMFSSRASKDPRARDTCIAPCPSDPLGVRALEDLVKHSKCPLEIIAMQSDGYHDLKEDIQSLLKDMRADINALKKVEDAEQQSRPDGRTDWHLHNISTMEGIAQETLETLRGLEGEKLILAERFVICTDMLTKLNKHAALRRTITYKRQVNPQRHETPWLAKMWYIVFPCLLFFLAFGFQSFMLHVATHFYVYYMEAGPEQRRESGGQLFDLVGNYVGQFLMKTNPEGQGAVIEGNVPIPTLLLDASGAIPLGLCAIAYLLASYHETFNIGLWNKTFLVASIMACLKGLFDAVTILPDSIGWDSCQERLGRSGLHLMHKLAWKEDFWGTLWSAVLEELVGGTDGRRVRYCADMMISGHTYFATLFALSAYKQIAFITDVIPRENGCNRWVRRCVACVCILCISTEVLLVAAARFHYTVDMLSAIVLVLILWDSSHIEQIAADWSEGFRWRCAETFKPKSALLGPVCDANKGAIVLPSQSSCTNLRVLTGHPPWIDPGDLVMHDATNKVVPPEYEPLQASAP